MKIQNQIIQLNPILESLFGKFGFSKLTEIQKKASSIILQKKDCLIITLIGLGKIECSAMSTFFLLKNSKKTVFR